MPQLQFSQALTANQQGFNPLSGWQYEYLPFGALIKLIINSTGTSAKVTVYSGSETVVQRSPISSGGTAGVMPAELNYPPIAWAGAAGDRLIVQVDETGGLTPTVNGIIYVNPA